MLTGHGDDIYRYGNIRINFSSNIFSHADLSALKKHLCQHIDSIDNYPEPEPLTVEKMIADRRQVSKENVMVTNGATEAIYIIAQTYAKQETEQGRTPACFILNPTFSEYGDACSMYGFRRINRYELTTERALVWLCNPNNPTGEMVSDEFIQVLQNRNLTFVIDQSYEDYTQQAVIQPAKALQQGNIIIINSLTKTYSIPGLRIGYVIAPSRITSIMRASRYPWSVNAIAIEAARFLIANDIKVIPDLNEYLKETQRLRNNLNLISGIDVRETMTNFMLAHIDCASSAELKDYLIKEHGILIRDASNFEGLDNHYFRVATQLPSENDELVAAIREFSDAMNKNEKR
jgi:threonine-phosphate decarboxylase